MTKKIELLYTLKSSPDVAAVKISDAAGHIALRELERLIAGGIAEHIDPNAPIAPIPSDENPFEPDPNIVTVTFNVSGSLKVRMLREEAKVLLANAKETLHKPFVNEPESLLKGVENGPVDPTNEQRY